MKKASKKVMVEIKASNIETQATDTNPANNDSEIVKAWIPEAQKILDKIKAKKNLSSYEEYIKSISGFADPEMWARWMIFKNMPIEVTFGADGNLLEGKNNSDIDAILVEVVKNLK